MQTQKTKIHLTQEQETLLITLYAKCFGVPKSVFYDPKAYSILNSVDYDFTQLKVTQGTKITICLRAKRFDQLVQDFLNKHPDGTVMHLGAGLDSRFQRLDNERVHWVDLDLPDVIDLRKSFFEENDRCQMIAASAADLGWLDMVKINTTAVMILAEGLMMYLTEEEVRSLLLALQERFPGSLLAFDSYSPLTVRHINKHPSIRKTGARIQWGIDDPHELELWHPDVKFVEEWFFDQSEFIPQLDRLSRALFCITRRIKAARRAHRILVYEL